MSHWTTSGRDRLKAAQKSSFAQQRTQRAKVVAPESMVLPGQHPHRQAPPSHQQTANRRSYGT